MIPFSILDLAPIAEGATAADAFRNSLELAQHAERWGFRRFWLAEHHNMLGIASAATAVVIGHVAEGTKTIRVGAGGVMLPNHAPLVIAEQFGTLASLYPGRIDLGLGRAPGADVPTTRALRRDSKSRGDDFPRDVLELQSYFEPAEPGQKIRAVPGAGLSVPIWLLGSSLFGAQLAAMLGLPFAFASHFAPADMMEALQLYRGGLPAFEGARPALCHGVRERGRCWYGRGGTPTSYFAPASLRATPAGNAGTNSAADRRHRKVLVARGKGHGQSVAGMLCRGVGQDGGARTE